MGKIFKKTPNQLTKVYKIGAASAVTIAFGVLAYLLYGHAAAHLPDENLIQATVMSYRLKVALGLTAVGGLCSYGLTWLIAHSPIGKWIFHWDDVKDDSYSRSAKIVSLGIVYGSTILGVFKLLSSVISSS